MLRGNVKKTNKKPKLKECDMLTEVKEGCFYVPHDGLHELRKKFLLEGVSPRTTLTSVTHIFKLVVPCDTNKGKRTGECTIYDLPRHYDILKKWVDRMQEHVDLKWTGQGLAGLTLNTIELLMKPKRQTVDHHRKFGILKAQKHQCNICRMNLVFG